ncbi:serum paraoxonase/arylesterase family protein [Xylariaceae sp. FL1019]|nr:serum paraoxonase/arylesterase family protein [Xylariaceae sp. FL1019]
MAALLYLLVPVLGLFGASVYEPVRHTAAAIGLFRVLRGEADIIHGVETHPIPDTITCEDLEYHPQSGMIYAGCSGDLAATSGWMPGGDALAHPENAPNGTIVIVDSKTLKSQKLSLENFEGRFATHGISLFTDPTDPEKVYIFAINHLPNPKWVPGSTEEKAASQVELFVHNVGSDSATHIRSIAHPMIRTPNDLIAISPNEFLVTNDHFYREGRLRFIENFMGKIKSWTDLVHVRFDDEKVDVTVALDTIGTNNGIAWGPSGQVVIGDAAGGHVYFAELGGGNNRTLTVSHSVPIDNIVDNPSFFADPYAGLDGKDYSGYLAPGASHGLTFLEDFADASGQSKIPGEVWYLPLAAGQDKSLDGKKLRKRIFADDGSTIRSVTTAALVAIDPATNDGKREAWLFVTGVVAPTMVATRINLESLLV